MAVNTNTSAAYIDYVLSKTHVLPHVLHFSIDLYLDPKPVWYEVTFTVFLHNLGRHNKAN